MKNLRTVGALAMLGWAVTGCSGEAPTADRSALETEAPETQTSSTPLPEAFRGGARSCTSPSFSACSDGQVVTILEAMTFDHVGPAGGGDPALDAFEATIQDEWAHYRQTLDDVAAHEGIAPASSAYAGMMEVRRDDFTDGGAFSGGSRSFRWYVGREVVIALEQIALIDRVLAPSAEHHALTVLLRAARHLLERQLHRELDALAAVGRPCGGDGATHGACGPDLCGPPTFAVCGERDAATFLALQLGADALVARTEVRLGVDAAVSTFAQSVAQHADDLAAKLAALGIPANDDDLAAVVRRTAIFERARLLIDDTPRLAADEAFVRYGVLERLEAIGVLERLLVPSVHAHALLALLYDARRLFASELVRFVQEDDRLDGTCGGAPEPPDAGAPDACTSSPGAR